MSSNPSTHTRIQVPGNVPPRPDSTSQGAIVIGKGGSTTPIDDQPTVISKDVPLGPPLAIANLAPAEMGRLLLGQRLGHYDLLEFVGGGGMGAVFKAHDSMLDRIVAVKVLSKVQSDDEETLRRFKNEAQSAARLDHDNIGRVHYVGEDRGWHYIVFEYIEGVNLRDLVVRDGPLPLTQAVSYTLQIADALAHASQRDVVHRDIKPSNVLITPEGRAKLVDMGLARLHQVAQPDQDLTASGVTLGTFDYISPEQARDPRNADVRSDLYSLGCTLYFALTSRPPFPDGTVLQKLLQHQADEPVDARELRPDLPDELARVLKKLLAKSPQNRYQLPDELVSDLIAIAARFGLEVPPPSAAQRFASVPVESPRWVRHLPWMVPLGVLAAVVIWFAVFGPSRGDTAGPPPIRHTAIRNESAAGVSESPATANEIGGEMASGAHGNPPSATADSTPKSLAAQSSADASVDSTPLPGAATNASRASALSEPASKNPDVKAPLAAGSALPEISKMPAAVGNLIRGVRGRFDALLSDASAANSATSGGVSPGPVRRDARPAGSSPPAAVLSRDHKLDSQSGAGDNSSALPGNATKQFLAPTAPSPSRSTAPSGESNSKSLPAEGKQTEADSEDDPSIGTPGAEPSPSSAANVSTARGLERKDLLVVSPAAAASRAHNTYTTLAEACRAARNGDVVEIRTNGPLHEPPLDLVGIRLSIRAGEGFSPELYFEPQKADLLRESHGMLTLGGSQLSFVGLRLEFDVPHDAVAESWSLAEVRPGESLRLEGCVLTVKNGVASAGALYPDVAMFDIRAVPGPGVMSTEDDPPAARPPASLQLKDCILRGEATMVRNDELQPLQLTWDNGLLATSERLLSASGGPSDPKTQGEMQIELRHVTALMRGGLCRLTSSQDSPQQLPLDIKANDCIFVCDRSAALIEQSGIDATDDFRRRIVWNGERNFYEGFSTFWRIEGAGAETPVQSTLHDWKTYWGSRESRPSVGKVVWQQIPSPSATASARVPAEFALQVGDNPAQSSAADNTDAGMNAAQLPTISDSRTTEQKSAREQSPAKAGSPPP